MPDVDHNPYEPPSEIMPDSSFRSRIIRHWRLTLAVLVLWIPAAFCHDLATAPYHPPHDMSSLLGAGGVETALAVAICLAVAWVGCVIALAMRLLAPDGAA